MFYQISEANYACIGRVAVESTVVEETLDWMIPSILRLDTDIYKTLTWGKPLNQKIQMFNQAGLLTIKGKKRRAVFSKMVLKLVKLNEERNVVVHGKWSPAGAKPSLGDQFNMNNSEIAATTSRQKNIKVPLKRLPELVNDFQVINSLLWTFWKEAWLTPFSKRADRRELNKMKVMSAAAKYEA